MAIYWILMILLVALAGVITLGIANSKENKTESASRDYPNRVGAKMIRLSIYYVGITVLIGAVLLFVYLYYK